MAASGKVCSLWGLRLLLVASSTMVSAVDINLYSSPSACGGSGITFRDVPREACCVADAGSVLFTGIDACKASLVFKNGACGRDPVSSSTGTNIICYDGGGFKSACWSQSCRRRSLLGDEVPKTNEKDWLTRPTGLVYTDKLTKETWILDTPNAYDLIKDFEGLSDLEQLIWIKSHGARYVSYTAQ